MQKIWFDLSTPNTDIARRQTFDLKGEIQTDARYSDYQFLPGGFRFPLGVDVQFPDTDTHLDITFTDATGVAVNGSVPNELFVLDPHPGAKIYKFEPRDTASVTQQR